MDNKDRFPEGKSAATESRYLPSGVSVMFYCRVCSGFCVVPFQIFPWGKKGRFPGGKSTVT